MTENELFKLIKPIVDAGLAANSINAKLIRAPQPTRQGVDTIQVFMESVSNRRYGWPQKKEVWNADNGNFDHVETQQMEAIYQMGCLVVDNPKDVDQLLASDVLNIVAAILQSDSTIETLEAQGCGIYRVTELRNSYFANTKDQMQSGPSFDFTVTHKQVTISTTPKVDTFEYLVHPI